MRQRFGMATNVNFPTPLASFSTTARAWTEPGHYAAAGRQRREPQPFHLLVVHLSSEARLARRCDGLSHSSRAGAAGEIDLVPAGLDSEWQWSAPRSSLLLHLSPELLGADRPSIGAALGETDAELRRMAIALGERPAARQTGRLVEALAQRIGERYGRRPARIPAERLGRIFAYIAGNLDGDLSLETLASLARMSPFYFVRQFKQATGWTPHQYVIRARVERARELLGARQANLCDIAYTCGFSSQSHFTNLFRREVGSTPQVFRRQLAVALAE